MQNKLTPVIIYGIAAVNSHSLTILSFEVNKKNINVKWTFPNGKFIRTVSMIVLFYLLMNNTFFFTSTLRGAVTEKPDQSEMRILYKAC